MKPPNITYDANIVYIFVRSLFKSPKSIAICEATKMKQDTNIILNFVSIILFHGTKVNEQINPTVTFFYDPLIDLLILVSHLFYFILKRGLCIPWKCEICLLLNVFLITARCGTIVSSIKIGISAHQINSLSDLFFTSVIFV